jgi:hypothetical protein
VSRRRVLRVRRGAIRRTLRRAAAALGSDRGVWRRTGLRKATCRVSGMTCGRQRVNHAGYASGQRRSSRDVNAAEGRSAPKRPSMITLCAVSRPAESSPASPLALASGWLRG